MEGVPLTFNKQEAQEREEAEDKDEAEKRECWEAEDADRDGQAGGDEGAILEEGLVHLSILQLLQAVVSPFQELVHTSRHVIHHGMVVFRCYLFPVRIYIRGPRNAAAVAECICFWHRSR